MRTIRFFPRKGSDILHVETPLGIVNIHVGLHDTRGRRVESVTFRPNDYAGERKVRLIGTRFVENLRPTRKPTGRATGRAGWGRPTRMGYIRRFLPNDGREDFIGSVSPDPIDSPGEVRSWHGTLRVAGNGNVVASITDASFRRVAEYLVAEAKARGAR